MDGNLLIHLSGVVYFLSFTAILSSVILKNLQIKYKVTLQHYGVLLMFIGCITITISFLKLMQLYIISDISFINVAANSSGLMPIYYRISAVWGNHEGSILLLLVYFSIISAVFYRLSYKHFFVWHALVIQLSVIIIVIVFIITTSNPFLRAFPIPQVGLGLNPMLQDFGLILHPPILYLGHAGCFIIYSIVTSLCRNPLLMIRIVKPWIALSLSFLTAGIGLGSWWAYKEIGWGGFWFWDPVENISLLPWLVLCALSHFITIEEKYKKSYNITIFLCILSFIVVLFGIFIVRAGLLKSIHSFAHDLNRGILLLGIVLFYSLYGFKVFIVNIQNEKSIDKKFNNLILINNWSIIGCITILLISIFYPLYSEFIHNISITVSEKFFNISFNTLIIFSLILYLASLKVRVHSSYISIIVSITLIILLFNYLISFQKQNISYIDILAVVGILISSIIIIKSFIIISRTNLHMIAIHMFISLGVLVISTSCLLSLDKQYIMRINDVKTFEHFKIKLVDVYHTHNSNYITKIALIKLEANNAIIIAKPELRIYPIEKSVISKPTIVRNLLYDLHLNINQTNNNHFLITVYYRPMLNWLWVAISAISLLLFKKAIYLYNNTGIRTLENDNLI